LGHGPQAADLFVEFEQFADQLPEAMKLGHLVLGLLQGGGTGKGFRHGLPFLLAGKTEVRTVAGVVGFMAVAVRLPAATTDAGDGSAAEVPQRSDLAEQFGPLQFEFEERVCRGISLRINTLGLYTQKRKRASLHILVAHPLRSRGSAG
jgi:hypothetical protein